MTKMCEALEKAYRYGLGEGCHEQIAYSSLNPEHKAQHREIMYEFKTKFYDLKKEFVSAPQPAALLDKAKDYLQGYAESCRTDLCKASVLDFIDEIDKAISVPQPAEGILTALESAETIISGSGLESIYQSRQGLDMQESAASVDKCLKQIRACIKNMQQRNG